MEVFTLLVAFAALIVAITALVTAKRTPLSPPNVSAVAHTETPSPPPGPPALVVNPTKVDDIEAFRRLAMRVATQCQLPPPLWFETTVAQPGEAQAREAVAQGASVIVAVGGDGTVRQVAAALVNTGVPLALVPMGTGNLLARNLKIPLGSTAELIAAAFTGRDALIDVGWLRAAPLTPSEARAVAASRRFRDLTNAGANVPQANIDEKHIFLVIAGLGFDAAIVAGANDGLKERIGWLAYSLTAVKHLTGRRIEARMWMGDETTPDQLRARTIMFANCGRLPGGVTLLPDARLDDGWMDVATIDATGGLVGWLSVAGTVLLQGIGVRRKAIEVDPGTIDFRRCRRVKIYTRYPEAVQVDGDLVGISRQIVARIEPGALLVRS
ncbi:MAG: diacylglycerol kinase family protein [Bowdeniella nasicola]|nr:diacylglycerol kinase family protein [Bowdeniella nasicola]